MSEIKISSNHQARDLVCFYDMPEKEQNEFDYVREDHDRCSLRFFKYKGEYYDSYEFVRSPDSFPSYWQGYQSDSFFSGLLIRFSEDDDSVIVGQYCC